MTYPPFVLFDNSNAQHQKSSCYDNILSTNDVQYCQSVLNHHILQVWEEIEPINLAYMAIFHYVDHKCYQTRQAVFGA